MTIFESALQLIDHGYDVVPVGVVRNGVFCSKDPGVVKGWPTKQWALAELRIALEMEARRGIGLRLSLETVVDIEADTEDADQFASNLFAGVTTVSWRGAGEDGHFPGIHRLFKLTGAQQNWIRTFDLNSNSPWPGGIEVRTNGQSVLPPSSGRSWIVSPPDPIAVLPDSVFTEIVRGMRCEETRIYGSTVCAETNSPGSDFCMRGEWGAILGPHGWQVAADGTVTRPGKKYGVSGTCKFCHSSTRGDLLYIFSTSEEIKPLQAGTGYSKFEAYAVLNHGGDFSEAARELKRQGFGTDVEVDELFDDLSEKCALISDKPIEVSVLAPLKKKTPVLEKQHYDNIIGEYCLALRQVTWVDISAIYLQALEIFGALVGRNAWYSYGDNRRMLSDYLVVVGETGSGKGLAFDRAKALFLGGEGEIFSSTADSFHKINMGRFGSGEGLIAALMARKDSSAQIDGVPIGEQYRGCVLATDQEGVGSFTKMLADGSTLGDALLKTWDTNSLSNSTKLGTLYVKNPLVSLIWHITPDVLENLPAHLLRGGLINRLKFTNCHKPAEISREKAVPEKKLTFYRERVEKVVEWVAEEEREMKFHQYAEDAIWEIQKLQHGLEGIVATTHERYTAHVERMACRLAVLEMTTTVEAHHVEHAHAIHRFSFEWTEFLIRSMRQTVERAEGKGPDRADLILDLLRDHPKREGYTRTEVRQKVFHGNITSAELSEAIDFLVDKGITKEVKCQPKGKGRPTSLIQLVV